MIRHIVMWTLQEHAEGNDRRTNARLLKERLEALPARIPQIRRLQAGVTIPDCPFANHDVVLDADFDSYADLEAYQVHPAHKELVEFVRRVRVDRASVDFEV